MDNHYYRRIKDLSLFRQGSGVCSQFDHLATMKAKGFWGTISALFLYLFTSSVLAADPQILHGHILSVLSSLQPVAELPATNRLNLAISLPLRNQAQLTELLSDIYNPASPNYRHFLTPAEFAEKFGPTEQDYQAVIAFAKANHLRVTTTYANRGIVDVNGSAADIERALHLSLNVYQHPTEHRTFYAPTGEPSLNLSVPILHISGLDNFELPRPRLVANHIVAGQNASPNAGSGPGGAYRGFDFRAAYAPGVSLNGKGQSVGLLEFDGYSSADITYYENAAGLPNVPLQDVLIDGATAGPGNNEGDVEVALDMEVAISMATNLTKLVVYQAPGGAPFEDILNQMVVDDQVSQFSCSWYIYGGASQPAADNIWQEMAAQGQSFFNASGDGDAWTGLIFFPGDSPYITEVGGTTLSTTGPGGSWSSETVWNWGIEIGPQYNGVGSGGGISTQYPIPSWQTNISMAANQGSTTMRNTPDVAMTADNVYVRADGGDYSVGGTSCAAPLWAGFAALVNQEAVGSGRSPVGFINPALDAIGTGPNYAAAFHDITTGNNTWSSSPSKFYAVPGYDLCSGWGTPAGQPLIDDLANPEPLLITPANGFTSTGGVGGPFTETSQELTLTNSGTNSLTWSLSNTSQWLNVSSAGGVLNPGGPAATVTVSLNNTASNLVVGTYSATLWFTNQSDGFGQGREFTLNVIAPPTITMQPANEAVLQGAPASFSVSATGGLPLSYQWQFNGTNLSDGGDISGSLTTNLVITGVTPAQVGNYDVVVSNFANVAVSSNAALTITPSAPVIIVQPTNQTVFQGTAATFAVTAYGSTPSYQWSFDGTNITGATNSVYVLANAQPANAGTYSVLITNTLGSALSSNATLTVQVPTLAGYWPFNEGSGTVLHDIINGDNGTINNGTWGSGIIGSNLAFNGSSTYVGIPSTPNLNFGTNAFTISVWFFGGSLTNQHNSYPAILSNNPGSWEAGCFALRWQNLGKDDVTVHWNPEGDPVLDSGTLNEQQWYNAVVVRNGTTISLYIDAALTATATVSATDPINLGNGGNMFLGGNTWDGGNSYYLGSQEQLRIYQGALSLEVITNLYTIIASPIITTQPQSQSVITGNSVTFNVVVSSPVPPSYQWQFDGTNILDATNATYAIPSAVQSDTGIYTVVVANPLGSITSSNAVLGVYPAAPPVVTTQPTNQTVAVDGTANFSVTASGLPPLSYQWTFDGTNILDATNTVLTLTNVQFSQTGNYAVLVTNVYGPVISSNGVLTVYAIPPFITTQPANQAVTVNGSASFSVTAGGTSPLSYQWSLNTTNIAGATNATLMLNNVQPGQGGAYAVLVTNNYGSILSSNATLTVQAAVLVGYWPFNEGSGTVLHDIINGDNGTINNGTWGSGIIGSALSFNGSSTYVGIPSTTNLNFGTNPFSVSLWFSGNTRNSYPALLSNNPGGWESGSFALRYGNQGNDVFSVHWYPTDYILESGTLNPNTWHNAVFLRNGTNISLYIDAVLTSVANVSAAAPINLGNGGNMLLGGNTWDGGNSYYLGSQEQLRIYQGTLSQQQITNLYTAIAPPTITTQPQSQAAMVGSSVTFNVVAASAVTPGYQWQFDGTNITDATNATYMIPSVVQSNTGTYAVVVANALGSVTSSNAMLTVFATAPSITNQPVNLTVTAASSATFSVIAGGTLPLSYQWNFDNTNIILGATNSTLTLTNVQFINEGDYSVTVTNAYGSILSSNALLVVTVDHFAWNAIPSPRFLNTPFAVKVTAQNAANAVYTNFTGVAFLSTTNGIPVAPAAATNFVQGIWTGTIAVSQTATNVVLSASDGAGHIGLANAISVVNLPSLSTAPFSGEIFISWPTNPAGFLLEKSTNLEYGPWLPVNGTPPVFGGQYVEPVIPSLTNSSVFYRLYFNGP
jgi:subtilase family serine protease